MTSFACAAILFDLDGVLVDSTHSVTRQWRQWAIDHGIDPAEVLAGAHGVRSVEVIRRVAPHLDPEEEMNALEIREANDIDGVEVMLGAAELLNSIPRKSWCVVTSGTRHLASSRLRMANLPIPDVLVTANDVIHGKPHPEPYLKGAQLLGVDPRQCLVIEDAPAGVRAAHEGGMKAIGITSTFPEFELQEADAVVNKLAQINIKVADGELNVEILTADQ